MTAGLRERELWFVGPGRVELRTVVVPITPLLSGEVKVRALCSGVSQGTELLLYGGEGPRVFDPSLGSPGAPLFPRRYGYSWVGEIVASQEPAAPVGQRVFALRPHGDEHLLRLDEMRFLPPSIPPARATLAANLETALTVMWDAGIAIGDRVVVVGGGIVGLLCTRLAVRAGAGEVVVIEPSPRRREAALALGADLAIAPDEDVATPNADVVIEASGQPASLDQAIAHAAIEATVVVASFYGERRSPIALGSDFHRRRLQLKASQVSELPAAKRARWNHDRRFAIVIDLLRDDQLDLLLDPPVPFANAPEVYARLAADPGQALQTVFEYT